MAGVSPSLLGVAGAGAAAAAGFVVSAAGVSCFPHAASKTPAAIVMTVFVLRIPISVVVVSVLIADAPKLFPTAPRDINVLARRVLVQR